ncbi:proton-conducting transporter transmembrane domain-containing protein [Desulfotalea psychrophila]|uniref:Probable hydrogenase, component B-formate hydrogenlyase subunit 3 n=1 Tax=Desulfotalea psychrophila (strain LSv54 / DSM 12343) TaxID=177439 RepID=Q6APE8_DESPS|nr:proton-conducting transporter membrane subunit [Desulfotalea psychrophila]CAG35776.1 probable hydrogenase, component B-formate hydrogenlyase subunit 3 [Desulfotalea psychrophila LSv54]
MMNIFLLSLTVLFVGGIFSLLSYRHFNVMKVGYVIITAVGCAIGIYAITIPLHGAVVPSFSRPWLHLFTLSFSLDALSAFFLIPIFVVCPLAALYSYHYMDKIEEKGRIGVSFFFFNLLLISMALVTAADNIISFLLVWELMSLSSFFLVIHDYQEEDTRRAGYIYFVFAQAGAMFIIAALALAYSQTGIHDFAAFATLPAHIKLIVFFLALVGFGSKAGIFPLHMWLPHAHPAAPCHISAIMSGVMIKMGIYGIIRLYVELEDTSLIIGQTVLTLGMISGILGVVYALGKQDIKKVLAYSSVENIGVILIGAGIGMMGMSTGNMVMASFGFAGCLLHVLNHSLFKTLLFLGAGAIVQKTGTRRLDELGGLIKRLPLTGKSFLAGSVSISGLPPFNGFISEFLIYYGAFHGLSLKGSAFLFAMLSILALAIIGGLAASCFTRMMGIIFLGEPRTAKAAKATEAGFTMTLPMIFLAASCLFIGLFPAPFVGIVFSALASIPALTPIDGAEVTLLAENLGLAARLFLAVLIFSTLLRKLLYRNKVVVQAPTWGCAFAQPSVKMQYTGTSYAMSIIAFFRPFIQIKTNYSGIKRIFPRKTTYKTEVDDIAEVCLIERIVTPLLYFLGKFRWIQHGHIQLYIAYIAVTIIVLLLCV